MMKNYLGLFTKNPFLDIENGNSPILKSKLLNASNTLGNLVKHWKIFISIWVIKFFLNLKIQF